MTESSGATLMQIHGLRAATEGLGLDVEGLCRGLANLNARSLPIVTRAETATYSADAEEVPGPPM